MLSTHSVFLYKASIVVQMSTGDRYPADSARNSPNKVITVYRCEMPSLIFPDGVCFRRWQNSPCSSSYIAWRPRIANFTNSATRVSLPRAATVFVISRDNFRLGNLRRVNQRRSAIRIESDSIVN